MRDLKDKWERITEGTSGWIVYILLGVGLALLLQNGLSLAFSTDYPVVTVKSTSMVPELRVGDIVFIRGKGNYEPGDVVVFGGWRRTPIIHRLVAEVRAGEDGKIEVRTYENFDQISENNLKDIISQSSSNNLFVTKGDNNPICDQCAGKGFVKPEEIYGKKIFKVPLIGWVKIGFVRIVNLIV